MRKYTFRLEQVRRVRRVQESEAKNELARRNLAVQAAVTKLSDRVDEYQESLSYLQTPVASIDAFFSQRFYSEMAAQAVLAAKAGLTAAQGEAAAAKEVWAQSAKKVRALDRLDDKAREEYQIELNRAETAEADDIGSGRWIRARQAESSGSGVR